VIRAEVDVALSAPREAAEYRDSLRRIQGESHRLRQLVEAEGEQDPTEFLESLKVDLFEDEVFVFTPKGDVKSLAVGSTPVDLAYAVHSEVGARCVGAKVNGKIVPLGYSLQNGDICEVLVNKNSAGPSLDWMSICRTSSAKHKIKQWFRKNRRDENISAGRDALEREIARNQLGAIATQEFLATLAPRFNCASIEDMYAGVGFGDVSIASIVGKVREEARKRNVVPLPTARAIGKRPARRAASGVAVRGDHDVLVRFARCCTPVPGDDIVGYISLGKGITIHRGDCPNVRALRRNPERFTSVEWEGGGSQSFRVQIAVDSWDRPRLLEDVARTFAEHGSNIVSYGGTVENQMARNWYVAEVGDVKALRGLLSALRNIDDVFDARRVTPS